IASGIQASRSAGVSQRGSSAAIAPDYLTWKRSGETLLSSETKSPPCGHLQGVPMNVALWIAQGLLAAMFLFAGITKTTSPKEKLEATLPWTARFPLRTVRLVGTVEGLAALGLVL